ncbi:MAG: hypothetical protein ACYC3Q_15035 [Gemmatimonadaceae bacterium]
MASRIVTDSAGRTWTCTSEAPAVERNDELRGRDVVLSCATDSVSDPVQLTVGWQWETMAAPGLARLLAQASPVPRR